MITITVDTEVLFIIHTLQKAGFEAYIVGGAVRDILLAVDDDSISVTDFDFTTNAKPKEILELFADSFYENTFGTVSITREHVREHMPVALSLALHDDNLSSTNNKLIDIESASKIHESLADATHQHKAPEYQTKALYEITTFRSDGAYTNNRHPETVTWGESLKEDVDRRDFTINALALEIDQAFCTSILEKKETSEYTQVPAEAYTLIDYHEGITDLKNGLIRTVGNPNKRFMEDALRILRAIRFSVQLNMQIEDETYAAIETHAKLLQNISWERIRDEFLKMLASNYPREAIEILDACGCLEYLLPELLLGKGVEQGGHHTTDVWEHSLAALETCPSKDPIVRLATLIHDIGKPDTFKRINGQPTFYNHEVVGAHMAKSICRRLKLSKEETERIFILVRNHMFYYQPENTDASIRRFMRKVGLNNIDDILDLREGDRLGSGAKKTSWRLEEMKQRMVEQLHQPFAIKDLAINGHDLMNELGLKPGPRLGEILQQLFEEVLEDPELNTREALLEKAKELA
ncbi:MAG: HDIG domain-containing protein [Pseudomonadales bacterium]|nr:HDIG domain-containing protein [Candidatus Woesebacteria bacterium]MCB9800872.1 HDIG domain-containing protein [Pseudomonadales bacterium]